MSFWTKLRNWLFPKITEYKLERQAMQTMQSMSQQTHPKEAFGLLAGKHLKNTLVVDRIIFQPFQNTSYSAVIRIDPTLTGIVGSFHSHPSPNAWPSGTDRRLFSKHPGVHCILPYPYNEVHVYNQNAELLGVHAITSRAAKQVR